MQFMLAHKLIKKTKVLYEAYVVFFSKFTKYQMKSRVYVYKRHDFRIPFWFLTF